MFFPTGKESIINDESRVDLLILASGFAIGYQRCG